MKTILVTGAAGFIGAKTTQKLLEQKWKVIGIDNVNDYYDVRVKKYRLQNLQKYPHFVFYQADIENQKKLQEIFKKHRPEAVINLAARAGVRYSLECPHVYLSTNTEGTLNLLEQCRQHKIKKFVLASTSSLYSGQPMPFKETLAVNEPISPYAASKKAAEAMCHSYHFLYGIDVTILRYFTVYGPAGRPDMSIFRFIKWIDEGKPMELFGDGSQSRDFTYVDDIADGTIKALKKLKFEIINLGGDDPHELMEVVRLIQEHLGKPAKIKRQPFHKADIKATWADISKARQLLRWQPTVDIYEGVGRTVAWYRENKSWLQKVAL